MSAVKLGPLQLRGSFPVDSIPFDIQVADFNSDGAFDLVMTCGFVYLFVSTKASL